MRVGITGGTGFLGRRVGERLLDEGHEVVVFTRDPDRAHRILSSRMRPQAWDPLREPIPPTQLDPLDAVVNLIGETAGAYWTPAKKRRIRESRVIATRNLVAGWKHSASPPKILLSSSATGYYGDAGETGLTEDSPSGTGFLADLCIAWEAEARAAEELGARVVYLRTSLPLDPSGGFLRALLPAFKLGLGAHLGHGRQWFPWLHLEDWVSLVGFALENEAVVGPLNATGPNPVRSRQFTGALGNALGRPVLFTVPTWALNLSSQARELALASQRVIPSRAQELGFTWRFPDLDAALQDLLGRD